MKTTPLFLPLCALLALTDAYCLNVTMNNEKTYLCTQNDDPIKFTGSPTIQSGYDHCVIFAKRVGTSNESISIQNYDFQGMEKIYLEYAEKAAGEDTPASNGQFLIPLEGVVPFNKYSNIKLTNDAYKGIIDQIQSVSGKTITGLSHIAYNEGATLESLAITSQMIKKFFQPAKVFLKQINSDAEEITENSELTDKQKKVMIGGSQQEILDDFAVTLKSENINNPESLIILDHAKACHEYKINTKINIATYFATNDNIDSSKEIALFKIYKETTFSGVNCLVNGTVNIDTRDDVIFVGDNSMFLNVKITAKNNLSGCLTLNNTNTIQNLTVTDCAFNNKGTLTIQNGGCLCYTYGK